MISPWGQWGQGITEELFQERENSYAVSLEGSHLCQRPYRKELAKIEELERILADDSNPEDFEGGNWSFGVETSPSRLQGKRDHARATLYKCIEQHRKTAQYRRKQQAFALAEREAGIKKAQSDLLSQANEALKGFPPVMKFAIVGGGVLALVGVGIVVWRKVSQ